MLQTMALLLEARTMRTSGIDFSNSSFCEPEKRLYLLVVIS